MDEAWAAGLPHRSQELLRGHDIVAPVGCFILAVHARSAVHHCIHFIECRIESAQ